MEKENAQDLMINVWIKGEGPLMTIRKGISTPKSSIFGENMGLSLVDPKRM